MNAEQQAVIKEVVQFAARNGHSTSPFLSPESHLVVDAFALFDYLSVTFGVEKEQLGRWFDEGKVQG